MALSLSITSGFITNSSSVIYNFPNELLKEPAVLARFRFYGIDMATGLMPTDVWHRSADGDTVAFTTEQKSFVRAQAGDFGEDAEPIPTLDPSDDKTFTLIASDEAGTIVYDIICWLRAFAERKGYGKVDYESFN